MLISVNSYGTVSGNSGTSWTDVTYTASTKTYLSSDFYFDQLTDATSTQMCSAAFDAVTITAGSFTPPILYIGFNSKLSCDFT